MRDCSKQVPETTYKFLYGGGKVTSKVLKGSIKLAEKGSIISSDDYISSRYIEDCLKENKLLAMGPYRVMPGTRVRSVSESSDHSINSFASNDSMSPASYIVQTTSKDYKGRSKYTKEEDIAMITFLIEEKRYKEAFGIRVWKDMERQKITSHTASSMNTRYRKHILPNIQNYKYDVDRRWLTKLTGGNVVKDTEPEFSVDALFTLKKKSSRQDTSTLGKKHLAEGDGDVFHFIGSDDDSQKEDRTNNSNEDTDIEIEDISTGDTTKTKISNKDTKQNNMGHYNDEVTFEESCERTANSEDNAEEKSKDLNTSKGCNNVHEGKEKTVKNLERTSNTDDEKEKMNETYTAVMSPPDIFMMSEESCEIEKNISGEEPVTKVICLDDGRLQMSQDGSDKNFEEEGLEMSAKVCKENIEEKSDRLDNGKSKKKTVVEDSVNRLNDDFLGKTDNQNGMNVEVVRNSVEVSEEAETQPPQTKEICSNEVTSSGQHEYENDSDDDGIVLCDVDSDDNDDDSFDEMLKSYITKRKAVNVDKSDTCNNVEIDRKGRKTSDTILSKRKSKAVRENNGEETDFKKRRIMTENQEISSSRDEEKQKRVAHYKATCQKLSDKYDISFGFVAKLLFQCSGDVNRSIAYIEYGPHSPELPPWTETDDKALAENPKASGLLHKFGLPDVINRYKFINYQV